MKINIWFYAFVFVSLILIGSSLNFNVTKANDCKMPIKQSEGVPMYNQECYIPFKDFSEVNKPILSDIIDIRTKNYIHHFSIGDFMVFLGGIGLVIIFTISLVRLKRKIIPKKEKKIIK
jgi:hypothetical protein